MPKMNQREFQEQDTHPHLRKMVQQEIIELGKLGSFPDAVGIEALRKLEYMNLSSYEHMKVCDITDEILLSSMGRAA